MIGGSLFKWDIINVIVEFDLQILWLFVGIILSYNTIDLHGF